MKIIGILITRARQQMAAKALACFLSQTYADKQLIILDDSEERSFPNGVDHPLVRYELSPERLIAQKRNMAAEMADGELIAHFDSDDWSAPERLTAQAAMIEESSRAVCGFCSMLFFDGIRAAKYVNDKSYALGTSLMYTREFWKAHPFRNGDPDPRIGEDNAFAKVAREAGELCSVDAGQLMVARAHPGNTSPKDMNKFNSVPVESIPRGFFA